MISTSRTYKILLSSEQCDKLKYPTLVKHEIEVTGKEILHAIITCGMPVQYLNKTIESHRINEIIFKFFVINSALEEDSGYLVKSDKVKYLETSERAIIQYYLGMFITKLISEKIFHVDYLIHQKTVDSMKLTKVKYETGNSRPDLFGYNVYKGTWSIWEAKGRTRNINDSLDKAYEQVKQVKTVNKKKPELAAANVVYFSDNKLATKVKDPESEGDIEINIDLNEALNTYYKPISQLFINNGYDKYKDYNYKTHGLLVTNINIFETSFHIGMPELLFNHLVQNENDPQVLKKDILGLHTTIDIIKSLKEYHKQDNLEMYCGRDLITLF
ncbi:hypothetical protein I5677_08680 [Mobilitalea sibirica]|uniref:Uncharacterized protein n=1 Tax=Mobilitalea sibirica TaxID=1462919 RepID=A0A8J7H2H0_9FIRM|nr:hypothetical protein [Mobilitalea sibirica]MBH1940963.1 hypothetical protein [Mobilitalea sibirica]